MNYEARYTLEQLYRATEYLNDELMSKLRDIENTRNDPMTREAVGGFDHVFYMSGEVLIFGGVSRADVIRILNQTGLSPSSYRITVEGGPLFFCDSNSYPDVEGALSFFLSHRDLPYAFTGTAENPGVFQFSSDEVSNLNRSTEPVPVGNLVFYIGSLGWGANRIDPPTYEELTGEDRFDYNAYFTNLNWVPGGSRTENLASIDRLDIPYLTFQRLSGMTERLNFSDVDGLREAARKHAYPTRVVRTSWQLGDNWGGGRYLGWRIGEKVLAEGEDDTLPIPLLIFPDGQMEYFDVNPGSQTEYHGAEGVYPVVLVELLEDVNINF